VQWDGERGCGLFITRLCCSFLLILFPCSSVWSHPWETVLHELLQCEYFPQAAVLHELLQHGSFPWSAVILQEQAAPVWVPHRVRSPSRKPGPAWAPFSTGLQVLPGTCSSVDFLEGHSLLWVILGLQVDICSTVCLHGLQGHSLPYHGLLRGLQRNLCSGAWSTSSLSFFTDLGVCSVVLLTLSHSSFLLQVFFFPFLIMLSQRRYHCH